MIRTPSDYIGYLYALGVQHPLIAQVITGENMRQEESTLTTARYPQMHIETPSFGLPIAQKPRMMTGRVFILTNVPEGSNPHIDIASDLTFRIARGLTDAIMAHAADDLITLDTKDDTIEISPIEARGSDMLRGWVFELNVEVDLAVCTTDDIDMAAFILPQFDWENEVDPDHPTAAVITIADQSLLPGSPDVTWYWQELFDQPVAVEFNPGDGLNLVSLSDGVQYRVIHVWMKVVFKSIELWAYAEIDSRRSAGRSVPFVPKLPY